MLLVSGLYCLLFFSDVYMLSVMSAERYFLRILLEGDEVTPSLLGLF